MNSEDGIRQEVVLVTRPAVPGPPNPLETLREIASAAFGLATYSATAAVALVEQTISSSVATTVNGALDRIVPALADAIIGRLDLTDLVIQRVDLNRIVTAALDSMDLTALVIDRVDIDALVAHADIEAVIDRIPIIPLANYVIEEIDLPQIIRESTGGIASDAMNTVRVQGVGADQLVASIADRFLFRRRQRHLDAPGEPESLVDRLQNDVLAAEPVIDETGEPG